MDRTFGHRTPHWGVAVATGVAAVIALAAATLPDMDKAFVTQSVEVIGPMAIVLLVALGIVVTPIPSGVIALVAGALYGAAFGGTLTILGAALGSSCAFALSRYFGRGHLMVSKLSVANLITKERSQLNLALVIFATRLIPFISFDAVSYVAGLTPIRFWRFLVATVLGTAPVCFAFAAAGTQAKAAGGPEDLVLLASVGVTLLLPIMWVIFRIGTRHTKDPRRQAGKRHPSRDPQRILC